MNTIQNQDRILAKWNDVLNSVDDIRTEDARIATAVVLENTQNAVNENARKARSSMIFEDVTSQGSMGGWGNYNYADTSTANGNGDARVPNIAIPLLRRIFPKLLAHDLVGVQPMQNPVGMAFAFRPTYASTTNKKEIGYNTVEMGYTGAASGIVTDLSTLINNDDTNPWFGNIQPTGAVNGRKGVAVERGAWQEYKAEPAVNDINIDGIFGAFGAGANLGDSENWGVGTTMPNAGYEFLKATIEAKTRKLGCKITREAEEDMKAMQGINAQAEINNMLSYEIEQEIDRQLLAEIAKSAVNVGNAHKWDPAYAFGVGMTDRVNALYTQILGESARIAVQNRRGPANWCVASPLAASLLESQIYNPLSVAGGLGNANAFGKEINNSIGVTQIGTLRNGTIKLYRDTLAGGEYILLGYKGANAYDAGIIYLPYIPLEIVTAIDPMTMNPVTAARTRYGITTNLFGAGQYYSLITLDKLIAPSGATFQF